MPGNESSKDRGVLDLNEHLVRSAFEISIVASGFDDHRDSVHPSYKEPINRCKILTLLYFVKSMSITVHDFYVVYETRKSHE